MNQILKILKKYDEKIIPISFVFEESSVSVGKKSVADFSASACASISKARSHWPAFSQALIAAFSGPSWSPRTSQKKMGKFMKISKWNLYVFHCFSMKLNFVMKHIWLEFPPCFENGWFPICFLNPGGAQSHQSRRGALGKRPTCIESHRKWWVENVRFS